MERVFGGRETRLREEMEHLKSEIENGQYKTYHHPFPHYLPEPGEYSNNIAIVTRRDFEEPTEVEGVTLIGPAFEICYIRDDRLVAGNPDTKHTNVDYRTLARGLNGEIYQGYYKKGVDHVLAFGSPTPMEKIEEYVKIENMNKDGSIDELEKRGYTFKLDEAIRKNSEDTDE